MPFSSRIESAPAVVGPFAPSQMTLARIFDAFYRLDHSRTRDTGGTGLGLMIVKTCMESCCGTVTARNRQPHGLEIRLQLAASDPVEKTTEPRSARA